jgi:translation initiation factor eIF-2B subunit delta
MNPTYILLPLLTPILTRTTLVLLGASALHSDGALYARSGTALVAMLAKEHRVPVVACVETYKFGERVTLDGVASNELGKEGVVLDVPVKLGAMEGKNLTPISFMYDLTPPSLITAVCTEVGGPFRDPQGADGPDRVHPAELGPHGAGQGKQCRLTHRAISFPFAWLPWTRLMLNWIYSPISSLFLYMPKLVDGFE